MSFIRYRSIKMILIFLLIILLIWLIILIKNSSVKKIDLEYSAFIMQNDDPENGEITSLTIDGNLKKPFGKDYLIFEGRFFIAAFPETKEHSYTYTALTEEGFNGILKLDNDNFETLFLGRFDSDPNFESMIIEVAESIVDEKLIDRRNEKLLIVAPATNYKEALYIKEEINKKILSNLNNK